jgi:hypothetical protein
MASGHLIEVDHRRRKNNLDVDASKKPIARVSVSEPLAVPPGRKSLVTAMEIGLVRDVVYRAISLHDSLMSKDNFVGKSYGLCVATVWCTLTVADNAVRTTKKVYEDTFPDFLVRRTTDAQTLVWNKWVNVDESVSTKVSSQLSHHPFFRKSTFEIIQDVEKSVEETKIWKLGRTVVEKIGQIIEKVRPKPSNNKEGDDEGNNSLNNPPESGSGVRKVGRPRFAVKPLAQSRQPLLPMILSMKVANDETKRGRKTSSGFYSKSTTHLNI